MSTADLWFLTYATLIVFGLASLVMICAYLIDLLRAAEEQPDRLPRPVQTRAPLMPPSTYDDYRPAPDWAAIRDDIDVALWQAELSEPREDA